MSNISRFRRLLPSRREARHWKSFCTTPYRTLGVFLIRPHTSGEQWPGQMFPPSSLPCSHRFHEHSLGEGSSSTPIPPDRVGQSTSCPFAVGQVVRRLQLIGRSVFGLGRHQGARVGIETPSTIWASCCSLLSKHGPTDQYWLCSLQSLAGTSLPSGEEGDLVGKEGMGRGCRNNNFLCKGTSSGTSCSSGTWGGSTLLRRVASSSGVVEVLCSSPVGLRRKALTFSSLLRAIRKSIHFCSSHAELQRTPMGNSDSLVWVCLTAQKSLGLETMVWVRNFTWLSSQNLGEVSHHPEASCWVRDRQNATACQQAQWRASGLVKPSLMMWEPNAILILAFNSFYQGQWVIFIISAWIHLWELLTGSGSSGFDQDQAADGQAGDLDLVPPVGVELHWRSSLRVGCCESVGPVLEIGTSDCLMVSPLARKTVMPGGNIGSLPS